LFRPEAKTVTLEAGVGSGVLAVTRLIDPNGGTNIDSAKILASVMMVRECLMIPFILSSSFWAGPILGPQAETGIGVSHEMKKGFIEVLRCFVSEDCVANCGGNSK